MIAPHLQLFIASTLLVAPINVAVAQELEPCEICGPGADKSAYTPSKQISIPGFEFVDTCFTLDFLTTSILEAGTDECTQLQSISPLCGCQVQKNPCSLCHDGNMDNVDLARQMSFVSLAGVTPTCEIYDAYIKTLDAEDPACSEAQAISSICGCSPPIENSCEFCPGEKIPNEFLQKELGLLKEAVVQEEGSDVTISPTCEFAETILNNVPSDDKLQCFGLQQRAFLCGCNEGEWDFSGADTPVKKDFIQWVPRISALLSFLVSCFTYFAVL